MIKKFVNSREVIYMKGKEFKLEKEKFMFIENIGNIGNSDFLKVKKYNDNKEYAIKII